MTETPSTRRHAATTLTPLPFSAHLHHAYEWLRQGHSLPTVVAGVTFQMTYTSIFGAFAAFVQLRTGDLYGLCRLLLPQLSLPRVG